jgi:hypothetical protein
MNVQLYAASTCLGISAAALLMADYGVSSLFGGWHPTHETAIGYGVLSIAISLLGKK